MLRTSCHYLKFDVQPACFQSSIKAKSKMSKAEKMREKKDKAKSFNGGGTKGKVAKNAKRWN